MEDVQKAIMDADLNITAICLYLFHGGLWFVAADLVHIQEEHDLRGSIPFALDVKGGE